MKGKLLVRVLTAACICGTLWGLAPGAWAAPITVQKEGTASGTRSGAAKATAAQTTAARTNAAKATAPKAAVPKAAVPTKATAPKATAPRTTTARTTAVKATAPARPANVKAAGTQRAAGSTAPQAAPERSSSRAESKEPFVRVLLAGQTSAVTVVSTDPVTVLKANGSTWKRFKKGSTFKLEKKGTRIAVNGTTLDSSVSLQAGDRKRDGHFTVQGKAYRGAIKAVAPAGSRSMLIVNEVPLEQYLYGVVPEEAVPSWPAAALEAQAVAARTYALYNMSVNKSRPYDVQPSTYHQVYSGKNGEYAATTRAVDATKGMVMTYGGRPIDALYHADGGGYTENSENVWGNVVPYLRGAKDFGNNAGTSQWTVKSSRQAIERALNSAGKGVGTLKEIRLSPLGQRPMKTADRGVSGRIKKATFVGSSRTVTVDGDSLRSILGLKSTLFDFYVNRQPPAAIDKVKSPRAYHRFGSGNQPVYIKGYGWGHGLGLSQWGAAEMAKSAGAGDRSFYQKILAHYYKGIKLEKFY